MGSGGLSSYRCSRPCRNRWRSELLGGRGFNFVKVCAEEEWACCLAWLPMTEWCSLVRMCIASLKDLWRRESRLSPLRRRNI